MSWKYWHQIENKVTKMNPSWNHDNKAREEKVWVEDQLTWNKCSLASLVMNEVQTLADLC